VKEEKNPQKAEVVSKGKSDALLLAKEAASKSGFQRVGAEVSEKTLVEFVKHRFKRMEEAKRTINAKFERCRELREQSLRVYQAHNPYNTPYRSAQFHQQVEGRKDEITENFPVASLRASTYRDRSAGEKAKGKERVLEAMDEEIGIEAKREALAEDIAVCGMGITFEDVCIRKTASSKERRVIDTIIVNPRDLYWDETARDFDECRDFVWRRQMPYSTFLCLYSGKFDTGKVNPAKVGADGKMEMVDAETYWTQRETEEQKTDLEYVVRINDYFNDEFGFRLVVANGEMLWCEKTCPRFSAYYNLKMNDSVGGVGIIEEIAPEVFALDTITQLAFINAKNQLQSMIIAAPDVGLHAGLKLQAGGVFALTGMTETGKVQDAFSEITLGKIPNEFFNMREVFLDNLSVSSQMDQRALLANPNQLATQTKAKQQSFAKRGRRLQRGLMWRSEKRRWEIRLKLLNEYIAPMRQEYYIDGYFVLQGDSDSPKFIKDSAANGVYRLRPDNANVEAEVIVTSKSNKAIMEEEEKKQLLQMFGMTIQAMQADPEFAQSVQLKSLHRAIVDKMELDPKDIYNDFDSTGYDAVESAQKRAFMGLHPKFPETNDVEELINQAYAHRSFLGRKEVRKDVKQIIIQHITRLAEKAMQLAEEEARDPAEREQEMMANAQMQQGQVQELPQGQQQASGAVPNMEARGNAVFPLK
jgi:hypothetical protein